MRINSWQAIVRNCGSKRWHKSTVLLCFHRAKIFTLNPAAYYALDATKVSLIM